MLEKEKIYTNVKTEKELNKEDIHPLDVASAIFAYSGKNEFPTNRFILHSAFKELKDKEEYKDLFEDYGFSMNEPYPFSRDIEESLDILATSGLVSLDYNPKLEVYKVSKESKEEIKELVIEFLGEESKIIPRLKNAAIEFDCIIDKYKENLKAEE